MRITPYVQDEELILRHSRILQRLGKYFWLLLEKIYNYTKQGESLNGLRDKQGSRGSEAVAEWVVPQGGLDLRLTASAARGLAVVSRR